ncbi:hypothetical protein PENTCL1PPCAC_13586, partial [Pristionchus entomophagus]
SGGFFATLPAGNEIQIYFIRENGTVFTDCQAPRHADWGPAWAFIMIFFGAPILLVIIVICVVICAVVCFARRRGRAPLIYQQPNLNQQSATSAAPQPE